MDSLQSQPQRPEHTRSKSAFSFRSQKSSGSGEKLKIDLTETEKERRKNKFSGKGFHNPNRALQEAEPAARALELTTIASLGGAQYKDWQGNLITDPDSSNPARSRMERPLDTIRSFEAAAEGSRKKQQAAQAESSFGFNADSRRSSFVGTDININPRSPAAIPGAQMMPRRVPSYQRDPIYDPYARAPPSSYARRGMGSRMSSAPSQMDRSYNQGQNGYNYYNGPSGQNGHDRYNGYPYHGHNESFDTNGDSTGSPSERWTNSTDPSSENSSIDRIHAINKQADGSGDAYGGAYQNGPGYPNGTVQHERSLHGQAPPMRQRQPIAEESWNEDRGFEGAYNYQGTPHQSGRPYQQQRSVSNMEGGMRGGAPPANYMPHQPQRAPQSNVTSPGVGKPFARKVMPLGGENRPNPAPAPGQRYDQPQLQTSRPKTLRKESSEKRSSEKPKSWLRRRFSKG